MIMFRYGGFIMRERRGGGEEWKGREGKNVSFYGHYMNLEM